MGSAENVGSSAFMVVVHQLSTLTLAELDLNFCLCFLLWGKDPDAKKMELSFAFGLLTSGALKHEHIPGSSLSIMKKNPKPKNPKNLKINLDPLSE